MNKLLAFCIFLLVITLGIFGINYFYLSAPGSSSDTQIFVVPENTSDFDFVASLKEQNLIKNKTFFKLLVDWFSGMAGVDSGGYRLRQNMNAWEVMRKLSGSPDLFWVKTSYCLRKEQIGEILQEKLGWDSKKVSTWNNLYSNSKSEYFEGVYYPDTYLIPVDESVDMVAKRYINNLNTKLSPLTSEMEAKNIRWTTVLKIASLISREAGGKEDMKLISGIIWNRLNSGMRLQIDATLAYTFGKSESGSWWRTIDVAQKQSDSPYNTYKREGLPPTPICSPGIDAIKAAIDPEKTDCLFYLHDSNKQIHCAKTYKEHLANIKKYLQ